MPRPSCNSSAGKEFVVDRLISRLNFEQNLISGFCFKTLLTSVSNVYLLFVKLWLTLSYGFIFFFALCTIVLCRKVAKLTMKLFRSTFEILSVYACPILWAVSTTSLGISKQNSDHISFTLCNTFLLDSFFLVRILSILRQSFLLRCSFSSLATWFPF